MQTSERSRKNFSIVLRAITNTKQDRIAKALEVSPATISRYVSDDAIQRYSDILAICGLKIVPEAHECKDPQEYAALSLLAGRYCAMNHDSGRQDIPIKKLDWGEDPE